MVIGRTSSLSYKYTSTEQRTFVLVYFCVHDILWPNEEMQLHSSTVMWFDFVSTRGNQIICSYGEEFHCKDVHLPVLHLLLLTLLCGLFSWQVRSWTLKYTKNECNQPCFLERLEINLWPTPNDQIFFLWILIFLYIFHFIQQHTINIRIRFVTNLLGSMVILEDTYGLQGNGGWRK